MATLSNKSSAPLSKIDRLIQLAKDIGVLRTQDVTAHGIPTVYLKRLCDRGVLIRSGRGLYVPADASLTESHSLVEACQRVPRGVICLLSALRFHGLTTENPYEVWMAIPPRMRRPAVDYPPIRFFRFSGDPLTSEVEEHLIEGLLVRVYSPAKTVADCFRYRNKIGIDVAVQALRDCWEYRRANRRDLWRCARLCRVEAVMRPYLEAIL